ncbi:asparagine synthase (glutamine-hydrolyzing) [Candidatus Pelagibacter sp.]|nr:asparagine synthase (glutamine-hydrolyzing) [Candidatus Pelagibacter sp.]|tara:strand:- start:431 stop:2353 length:1923 start_codon:yes stop_codon:yes gene_type:complete
MCGILGWCNFDKGIKINILKDISIHMKSRGPDNYGEFSNKYIGLVHRRLSIIDLSENAHQPIIDEINGNILIFNGEIYNFKELKREISELSPKKEIFKSNGDSEVILAGYRLFGLKKLLTKLEGMFAFSIWDKEKEQLFIARDKLGEKPLFYSSDMHGGIIFSSTVKSLITHPNLKNDLKIDNQSLHQYLNFNYLLFDKTFFVGIKSLQPGCYLEFSRSNDRFIEKKYWYLENCFRNEKNKKISFDNAKKKFSELLEDSVQSRVNSDVTIGSYLSGGIDSSAISLKLNSTNKQNMLMHNLSFKEINFDESKYADSFSKSTNTKLKIHYMPEPKIIALDFPEIVNSMDQPMSDTAYISNFYLSKFSSQYSKVVLSGDGADEMLCGYETYIADIYKKLFNKMPNILSTSIKKFLNLVNNSNYEKKIDFYYKVTKFFENVDKDSKEAHILWRSIFNEQEKKELFIVEPEKDETFEKIFDKYELVKDLHYLDQHMFIDLITWFPNDILYKIDRTTMHHSQEGRVPFIDTKLIEFCCSLPIKYKINLFRRKFILKQALKNEIEKKHLNRKKSGFNSPIGAWIKKDNNFKDLTYSLLCSEDLTNFLNKQTLINCFNDHIKGYKDNTYKIFTLIVLSQWINSKKLKF